MRLHEKRAEDGTSLEKRLDAVFADLDERYPGSRGLFVHLRDLHDGAVRLEQAIVALAAVRPKDRETTDRLLWDIRVELYEHLLPNHLEAMRRPLADLCDHLSEEAEDQ